VEKCSYREEEDFGFNRIPWRNGKTTWFSWGLRDYSTRVTWGKGGGKGLLITGGEDANPHDKRGKKRSAVLQTLYRGKKWRKRTEDASQEINMTEWG